jgi:hypothetical protein
MQRDRNPRATVFRANDSTIAEADEDLDAAEEALEVDQDLERVLDRLEREGELDGECWLWPKAGCNDQGYAVVSIGGRGARRMLRVHKWLWERENGPVPKGWTLEHRCHTEAKRRGECAGGKTCKHRRCCEQTHLEAMPHGENIANRDQ